MDMISRRWLWLGIACAASSGLLAGCSANKSTARNSVAPYDTLIAGRSQNIVVEDDVLATDPIMKGKQIYDPTFMTAEDGQGGGYVAMTAAFGDLIARGPRYTWLYHIQNNQPRRIFRFPFDATQIERGANAPTLKGDFWAYECLACDRPENGYVEKVPVKAVREGRDWKIIVDLPRRERERHEREARLVVEEAMAKYGAQQPEALRMTQQIDGLFARRGPAPGNRTAQRPPTAQSLPQAGNSRSVVE